MELMIVISTQDNVIIASIIMVVSSVTNVPMITIISQIAMVSNLFRNIVRLHNYLFSYIY